MNTKIEEIKKVIDSFDKLTDKQKNILNNYLVENIDAFSTNPRETILDGFGYLEEQTVNDFMQYVKEEVKKGENRLNKSKDDEDYARTINDSQKNERGKAFVESMSSQARAQDESMQQRRDERYEQMMEESETMDIPTIGSRKHL